MPRQRTPREADLVERAFRVLPGGTLGNVYLPKEEAFIISRGQGSHVWDVSGNEYIDYLLGSGPMLLGHAHPAVVQAVQEAVAQGSTFFLTNEPAVLLAEEITRAVPCAEKVRFVTSGTEADFFALRVARAYRRRDKILKFEGGYHGLSDYGAVSIFPKNNLPFPRGEINAAGVPQVLADLVLVAPYNDLKTTEHIIARHHEDLAAVIVEPFQRVIPPAPGFLQGLREITQRYGIVLIFDEVVTGFRFAYGGAQEYYGVVPDLATLGKIVGGGYPLAAVVGKEAIMRHFDPALEGTDGFVPLVGTLAGNPIAAVAGLATLRELRRPGTYERLFAIGRKVREGLQRALQEVEIPAHVVGEDPLFDVFFTAEPIVDYRSTRKANAHRLGRFNALLRERGILKGQSKFYISLAHTDEDILRTVSAFREVAGLLSQEG
ncbi:MAG: aspartate aminotransferase family protein [Dehalococcoidia bacterium]|nr:aspartate aminotransferase family protein [Dehalococcoidia bacterium]MDW8119263.1 aspartate aminotransferase family protein [Chloroflexota bacterium]